MERSTAFGARGAAEGQNHLGEPLRVDIGGVIVIRLHSLTREQPRVVLTAEAETGLCSRDAIPSLASAFAAGGTLRARFPICRRLRRGRGRGGGL